MTKFTNPLSNIKIASPCSQNWDEMLGTERKRFCSECKLNVYNLSGMSRTEAENLLLNAEGRLCVRFYRRADGSVLTKDCPVGWQAVKRRVSKTATAFASLFIGLLSGLGLTTYFKVNESPEVGEMVIKNANVEMTGAVAHQPTPLPMMGNIAIEKKGEFKVGKLQLVEQDFPRKPQRGN